MSRVKLSSDVQRVLDVGDESSRGVYEWVEVSDETAAKWVEAMAAFRICQLEIRQAVASARCHRDRKAT